MILELLSFESFLSEAKADQIKEVQSSSTTSSEDPYRPVIVRTYSYFNGAYVVEFNAVTASEKPIVTDEDAKAENERLKTIIESQEKALKDLGIEITDGVWKS